MTKSPQFEGEIASQWWVAGDNAARGPYSEAFVRAGLKSGSITRDTLLCPVGGQEWKTAVEWPPFAVEVRRTNIPIPPVRPIASQPAITDSPFTNPQLPVVANWICVYCILVSPILWCVERLSCCFTGFTFSDGSTYLGIEVILYSVSALTSLGLTIIQFVGGRRLRELRRSGVGLIKTAIWISLAVGLVFLFAYIGLWVTAGANTAQMAESNPAGDIISFFMFIFGSCELAFMVFSLVWLHRHENVLPLTDN